MSWGSSSADPHGIITFNHRTDRLALVREQICDDRDCQRGCWIITAYRRSYGNLQALEELYRLDLAADGDDGDDRRHDPRTWQGGLFYGLYLQSGWSSTRKRFQPSRGGVKAAGIKVPTPTRFAVVGLVEAADVGKKVPLPGGMGQLRLYKKRNYRGERPTSPGQSMFLPTSTPDPPDLPLLDWKRMQFWRRRIESLWNRRGGLTMIDDFIMELKDLLEARTPEGLLFRLLLDRPMGEDAPNISGIGNFWTDPQRRHCLGEDTPTHPSQWVVALQILTHGKWEDWRGDPSKPPEWADGRRWAVEEDRTTWNFVYDESGNKVCLHCGANTEAFWRDQRFSADGVALDELVSRVEEVHRHRDGTGFSVELADWSYDEFIETLAGKATTKPGTPKKSGPDMATVARGLVDELQPTEAKELSRQLLALTKGTGS